MNNSVKTAVIPLSQISAHDMNYNLHPPEQVARLQQSLKTFGYVRRGVVQANGDGSFVWVAGHGIGEAAAAENYQELEVTVLPVDWSPAKVLAYMVADNELSRQAVSSDSRLAAVLAQVKEQGPEMVNSTGLDDKAVQSIINRANLGGGGEDAEPQISRADELQRVWGVEVGQVWRLPSRDGKGEHRIICGDCTDALTVAALMGGDVADTIHADPPYGMGKENEGIANDNLYREKLDAFQMEWWKAARGSIADNGSAYIWGNAEDLWRLWYAGGLKDSERLTIRNEIVWDKVNESGLYDGNGIGSRLSRLYAGISERCLFFMLGEQGFNNNADNYWDTWDSIREYLKTERDKMKWSIEDTKKIAGHSPTSGCHWFDRSQWTMPTEEVYKAWQKAARGDGFKREYDGFKREYDELKREFYSTRAYFNNTHDNMTDVWSFPRVTGDDRNGHATPKPVDMVGRAIKSSCPDGGIVYVPFCGTMPELIASENLNRYCRGIEIHPPYVAVTLQRYQDAFNITPELIPSTPRSTPNLATHSDASAKQVAK